MFKALTDRILYFQTNLSVSLCFKGFKKSEVKSLRKILPDNFRYFIIKIFGIYIHSSKLKITRKTIIKFCKLQFIIIKYGEYHSYLSYY